MFFFSMREMHTPEQIRQFEIKRAEFQHLKEGTVHRHVRQGEGAYFGDQESLARQCNQCKEQSTLWVCCVEIAPSPAPCKTDTAQFVTCCPCKTKVCLKCYTKDENTHACPMCDKQVCMSKPFEAYCSECQDLCVAEAEERQEPCRYNKEELIQFEEKRAKVPISGRFHRYFVLPIDDSTMNPSNPFSEEEDIVSGAFCQVCQHFDKYFVQCFEMSEQGPTPCPCESCLCYKCSDRFDLDVANTCNYCGAISCFAHELGNGESVMFQCNTCILENPMYCQPCSLKLLVECPRLLSDETICNQTHHPDCQCDCEPDLSHKRKEIEEEELPIFKKTKVDQGL